MLITFPKKDSERAREELRLRLQPAGYEPEPIDRILKGIYGEE